MKIVKRFVSIVLVFVLCTTISIFVGGAVEAAESYLWPVPANTTITAGRGYSSSHKGIDIGGSTSYDIIATKSGTVVCAFSGCNNRDAAKSGKSCNSNTCDYVNPRVVGGVTVCNYGYGRGVVLRHSDGTYSCYAHMSSVAVKSGATVKQGQVLGKMGNYGYSSGVHLHFALSSKGYDWGTYDINCNPSNIGYLYSSLYTIAYNANGGSGTIASSTVSSGGTFAIAKSGFTRLGYTLSGFNVYRKSDKRWYTSGGWATSSEISSGNYTKKLYTLGSSQILNSSWTNGASKGDTYTFYAVWKANSYTIAYDANGGTGTIPSGTLSTNTTLTIKDNGFTREGYYFAGYNCYRSSDKTWYVPSQGWLTNSNLKNNGYTKKVYQPGETFNLGSAWLSSTSDSDTFTFYPIWKPTRPMVTFYENYGGANYMSEGINSSEEAFAENYYSRDTSVYTITRDNETRLNNQPSIKIVGASAGANRKDIYFDTDTNKGVDVLGYGPDQKQMTLSFWAKGSVDGAKLYWRWGYTTDYYNVTLTDEWKKYTVDVSKNMYDSDGLYFYLDQAGTFYLNNLYLRDGTSSEHYIQETGGILTTDYYEYGLTYENLPEPLREGYIFKGWYTAKIGGTEITADTEVLPYNISLYARWEEEIVDLAVKTIYDESGKKYELYQNSVSWEEAKAICEEKGGHLVTINSEEENDLVLSMIEDNVSFTWIGASYDTKTGTWNWVTDETFEYTNWNTGEPSASDTNAEYYAHMYSIDIGVSETKGKWNDVSGSSSIATYYGVPNSMYICEYEPQDVEYEVYTAGDVNKDGTINIFDVFMMARYNAGYIEFTEEQLLIGDANSDGKVNIFDVFMVARYDAGYDVDLPIVTIIVN